MFNLEENYTQEHNINDNKGMIGRYHSYSNKSSRHSLRQIDKFTSLTSVTNPAN